MGRTICREGRWGGGGGRGGRQRAGSCSAGADAATSSAGGGGAARGEGQGRAEMGGPQCGGGGGSPPLRRLLPGPAGSGAQGEARGWGVGCPPGEGRAVASQGRGRRSRRVRPAGGLNGGCPRRRFPPSRSSKSSAEEGSGVCVWGCDTGGLRRPSRSPVSAWGARCEGSGRPWACGEL